MRACDDPSISKPGNNDRTRKEEMEREKQEEEKYVKHGNKDLKLKSEVRFSW